MKSLKQLYYERPMRRYEVTYQSIEDYTLHTIVVEAKTRSDARGTALLQRGWEIGSVISVDVIGQSEEEA